MGIGKRLAILGCFACATCALVLIALTALALTKLDVSGNSVCIPGLSIRCHESDCGDYFQRCGSIALHEVPSQKVCYQGALLPARRKDLHSCPSTIHRPRNSTQACNCNCSYPQSCDCQCGTQGVGRVLCSGKIYTNMAAAKCCLRTNSPSCRPVRFKDVPIIMWKLLESKSIQFFKELLAGQWLLQSVAASFTFQAPLSVGCCASSGSCSRSCG